MPTLIASALAAGFFMFTSAPVASAPVAPHPLLPSYPVSLTAYNAVPGQTDSTPFTTGSGLYSNPEVIAARSADLSLKLPYGTVIAIERSVDDTVNCNYHLVESMIGYRVVGDAMNPRIHNRVDVLLDQNDTVKLGTRYLNPSRALGMCDQVTVHVVGYMKLADVPKTQADLAQMVHEAAGREDISAI